MTIKLDVLAEVSLGQRIGQLRAAPVGLGTGAPSAVLAAYCADFDVDPYVKMFFFPTDTLKLALITEEGKVLWKRDLGPGVVPGHWFCPVFAFDLDGDGVDEIWFVSNTNPQHPLDLFEYKLERIDAATGETTGQWDWPNRGEQDRLSHTFRNFISGGYASGEPVLFTAQGTYGLMTLQGWNPDMSLRWETVIEKDSPGARGSHMCAVSDLDEDGIHEIMWGERCIRLSDGAELFCADRDVYRGHSDIVQPVLDRASGKWYLFTCRESYAEVSPRVALFDHTGKRVWGAVDQGHMDMGWSCRLGQGGELVSMAIRIGHKTCGPDGRFHHDRDEFVFDTLTGRPIELPFSVYQTIPVDVNGDGRHELVRGIPGGNGDVLDAAGNVLGSVSGSVALASKFMSRPGEQMLAYHPDGTIRMWGDVNAEDAPVALERFSHPMYKANRTQGVARAGV